MSPNPKVMIVEDEAIIALDLRSHVCHVGFEVTGTADPAPEPASISDLVQSLRPAFLAKRWSDLEKMRAALAAQNFAAVQEIGHNCKGTGKGYGFPQISEIGASLEKAAKAQEVSLVAQAISCFERCLEDSQEAA